MPIHWDVEQQACVLGEVVTATTVRVYERVKPLRMQPEKGQYGSQEFDTFVDKVFNPMLIAADSEVQQPEGAESPVTDTLVCQNPANMPVFAEHDNVQVEMRSLSPTAPQPNQVDSQVTIV